MNHDMGVLRLHGGQTIAGDEWRVMALDANKCVIIHLFPMNEDFDMKLALVQNITQPTFWMREYQQQLTI